MYIVLSKTGCLILSVECYWFALPVYLNSPLESFGDTISSPESLHYNFNDLCFLGYSYLSKVAPCYRPFHALLCRVAINQDVWMCIFRVGAFVQVSNFPCHSSITINARIAGRATGLVKFICKKVNGDSLKA